MTGEQLSGLIAAVHEALRNVGLIESSDDHGDDDQRRDDDTCIALAGDLTMNLRRHGLTVSKLRSDIGRKKR